MSAELSLSALPDDALDRLLQLVREGLQLAAGLPDRLVLELVPFAASVGAAYAVRHHAPRAHRRSASRARSRKNRTQRAIPPTVRQIIASF
jgi:hypothetical protein